jgi:hypothetical protein
MYSHPGRAFVFWHAPEGRALRSDMLSVGRAFKLRLAIRRSGLYGPTTILSRSDIFKRRWRSKDVGPEGSDLQKSADHRGSATCPRRSGLYGPTAIIWRSDIFKRQWSTTSDLKAPTYKNRQAIAAVRHAPVGRAFMVRQLSFREATFSQGGGAAKTSDLKAPTYEDRHAIAAARHAPVGRAFMVRQLSFREATFSQGSGPQRRT